MNDDLCALKPKRFGAMVVSLRQQINTCLESCVVSQLRERPPMMLLQKRSRYWLLHAELSRSMSLSLLQNDVLQKSLGLASQFLEDQLCSFIIESCGVSKSTRVFLWLLCFQKDVSHRCIDFSPPPPS